MKKRKTINRRAFVPFLLEVITNKIGANATRRYQREFEVGLAEWRVISALAVEPGMTVVGLSEQSAIDAGAVSRVVFSLTERNYISQQVDPSDRRRRNLILTAQGWDLHDAMLKFALSEEEKLLSHLDKRQRDQLVELLLALYERLRLASTTA